MSEVNLWFAAQEEPIRAAINNAMELLEDIDDKLRGPYEPNHPRLFTRLDEVLEELGAVL